MEIGNLVNSIQSVRFNEFCRLAVVSGGGQRIARISLNPGAAPPGASQGSLQSLFELSISIVAVAVPSPKTFPWLGVVSLLQVLLAFLVYIIGYLGRLRRQRPSTIPSPPDCATAGGAVRGNEQDDCLPDCQADPWMDPCASELSERPN